MLRRLRPWASLRANSGRNLRRHVPIRAVAFLVLALVAVIVITAGSAATTTKPYTASFDPGPLVGGGTLHVNLAIQNLANPQPLGSANITGASSGSSSFTITGATTSQGDAIVTSGGVLQLRNLNLAPGGTVNVDIAVRTPCASGSYTWALTVKQSNNFNGPPGNDFNLQTDGSNLVTALAGTCKLVWVTEPANAVVNTKITGTAGDPSGPSVSVQAVDNNNVLLTGATGTVTLSKTAGSFTGTGGFTGTTASLVGGVATFSNFKSTAPGTGLMVQASSPGYVSTPLNEGGPFTITSTGANCLGQDPCLVNSNFGNSPVNAAATGGAFTFLGLNASEVPPSVIASGGGCQYFVSVGAGAFEAVDNRTGTGELRFTYNVPTKLIQKSPNNGQPFIPLCAGAKRLVNNEPVDCRADALPGDPDGPWLGRGLNPDGTFDGTLRYAVCGEGGYWWAVMGSFQQAIDPALNPIITGWGSTTIGNVSYRQFFLRVPNGWDWRVGG